MNYTQTILTALISGSVVATVVGAVLLARNTTIQEAVKLQFAQIGAQAASHRAWKERSLGELLGPLYLQFDRTERAFRRWEAHNHYIESKVIREGNLAIRDLLLAKAHLIPPDLLPDAGLLIEHYDRWLEEFARLREQQHPSLDDAFVFVGPHGYPFPRESAKRLEARFNDLWAELYAAGS